MALTSKLLNEREQDAYGKIIDAMHAVLEVDERGRMTYNKEEVIVAIHTLQHVVGQHALWRMDPDYFSDWWEQDIAESRSER